MHTLSHISAKQYCGFLLVLFLLTLPLPAFADYSETSLRTLGQTLSAQGTSGGVTDGGTLTISGESLGSFDYVVIDGNVTISSGWTVGDYFSATADTKAAVVVVNGNLTIDSGQTFTPSVRKLFTFIYVTGTTTVNGSISMSARGSNHSATTAAEIRIANGTFSGVSNPNVPASGGSGGAGRGPGGTQTTNGISGSAGSNGGTGGGGGGGLRVSNNGGLGASGAGAAGTSFSGGGGGGGTYTYNSSGTITAGSATANGGAGGNAGCSHGDSAASGGAGNAAGSSCGGGSASTAGTGGVLAIITLGDFAGTGTTVANGSASGGSSGGGGASGGGSVTVIYGTDSSSITPTALGGSGAASTPAGGSGGNGTARKLAIPASVTLDYKALSTANLPEPAISIPKNYFDAITYTGTGAAQSVTSADFQPALVWIKNRTDIASHALFDAVRGVQKFLSSDSTAAEDTDDTESLSSFDTSGFSLGTGASTANVNTNTKEYISWLWKEDPTSGFDIVSYTGNGTNRTISHALSSAPEMIIIKDRDAANDWAVYHAANTTAPETDYLLLNSIAATADDATYWNDTAPTASVFSVGTNVDINDEGESTVVYLTSGTSWTVPSDWNSSNNTIEVIGGGGGGGAGQLAVGGGAGGGGGAYSKETNVTLTPDATITVAVGSGGTAGSGSGGDGTAGGDTYLCNSTSNCASIAGSAVVAGAKGGTGGQQTTTTGAGGAAGSGVGTTKNSGGTGGAGGAYTSGGGGGGAAGPNGAGAAGGAGGAPSNPGAGGGGGNGGGSIGASAVSSTGGDGGDNASASGGGSGGVNAAGSAGTDGGGGGGGGTTGAGKAGGAGGAGIEFDATHGSGGGGGGAAVEASGGGSGNGGTGGNYGAGGGGGWNDGGGVTSGGAGAQGIIVITYTPSGGTGHNYIAYLFDEIEGFSKFGSYTGNGSADGPFVWTGFKPRFVMTKSIDSTSAWHVYDGEREGYNVDNDRLEANATTAEGTADEIDLLSNGFKLRIATDPNVAETYIYAAFAETPYKFSATAVTASNLGNFLLGMEF